MQRGGGRGDCLGQQAIGGDQAAETGWITVAARWRMGVGGRVKDAGPSHVGGSGGGEVRISGAPRLPPLPAYPPTGLRTGFTFYPQAPQGVCPPRHVPLITTSQHQCGQMALDGPLTTVWPWAVYQLSPGSCPPL